MTARVEVEGNHLRLHGERFVVKGTAYGPFAPRSDGARYPEPAVVRADLAAMAAMGLNTIRTFDIPPADLLNEAAEAGLRVIACLDYPDWRFEPFPDKASAGRVEAAGLAAVERLFDTVDDPGVLLAVSVGRTVPGDLVRVHDTAMVADTLSTLADRVHAIDPLTLVTYSGRSDDDVLTPVAGCDLISVELLGHSQRRFERQLAALQRTLPRRPVVVTDIVLGPDDTSAGVQARHLGSRLSALDRSGVAGATVAHWADDQPVDPGRDIDPVVSLVTGDRATKPTGRSVETWARRNVKDLRTHWPRVTAVVHARNNAATIDACLTALELSDYQDLEVIVCDAGSTDDTAELAERYPFTVLRPGPVTIGEIRGAGLQAATGEIVAFIDGDVVCHRQWPWFIALAFERNEPVAAVTRQRLVAADDDGVVAHAVAALTDVERLTVDEPATLLSSGTGGLAVRRSNAHSAGLSRSSSAVVVDTDLVHRLQIARPKGSIGTAPAAGATRPAHRHLSDVWRTAAARGRGEKQLRQLHPGRRGSTRRTFAHVLARLARGESPDRSGVARAWIDTMMLPLPIAAALAGIAAAGLAGPAGALTVAIVALTLLGTPAALVAAHATLDRRTPRPRRTRLAVAVIVLLEALAWWLGYLTSRVRPPAPRRRTWTGDRAEWLSELRWRLGLERLSVTTPVEPSPWDVDVRCGLFLRRMIVTAVAWQWTPHVRTALRFRPSIIVPVLAVAGVWSWSPMAAAMVASATVGELAFEMVTLRRVDAVIDRSIDGSLPPVLSPADQAIVEMARSTQDL